MDETKTPAVKKTATRKSKVLKSESLDKTNNPKEQGTWAVSLLHPDDQKLYNFVNTRISDLQKVRNDNYGINLNNLFADADRDYVPHRLQTAGISSKKVLVTDEDKGWRGARVVLGANDWQSDISQSNPYVKIQTALSILVDQNPSGVFTATKKQFEKRTALIQSLYKRSWEYANSVAQLKLFVFNLGKYGWAAARTYPYRITRKVRVLKEFNPADPSKTVYETKDVVEYNDIMRENLDVRNVWIDDKARPNNTRSVNDWCFRKVYTMEEAEVEFDKYPLWKYVQAGGNVQETVSIMERGVRKKDVDPQDKVEVYFYENKAKDLLMVRINGVPVIMDPLPVSDMNGAKKLTLWQTYWTLRHAESPYGIGIYEAIRFDQSMLDRIRNMTIDQLVLSIYKMFFYQGTQSLTETGEIKIAPGVGKQTLDPKNISWLEVPGPGQDSYLGIQMMRKDVDEASGVTDPLLGAITGKTAFEIAQAKEAALKRLKNPMDNILEALNEEAYITICLMQLMYSVPETYEISDPRLIQDYLKEINNDPDLYEEGPQEDQAAGEEQDPNAPAPQRKITAKVYREFPLNMEEDEKGNMTESESTGFFRVKPSGLDWEGMISIKSQSLLSPSKQIQKALELEMFNLLTPLLGTISQERAMKQQAGQDYSLDNLTNGKSAKEIIKLYDRDPRDIMPDEWFQDAQPQQQDLFIPAGQAAQMMQGGGQPALENPGTPPITSGQAPQANKMVSSTSPATNPSSMSGRISNAMTGTKRVL